jgi:hypothetical protein
MAVDLKALKNHPGRNPNYDAEMRDRVDAQNHNKRAKTMNFRARALNMPLIGMVKVPKQPNKYVPHQGAKELARG